MLVALVVMLLAFWLMSHFARKQQQKMQAEQERRTEEAMVPGTWVRTRAGFYGTVVEIDGDVVTLATPLGDESLWAKSAIVGAEEPPLRLHRRRGGRGRRRRRRRRRGGPPRRGARRLRVRGRVRAARLSAAPGGTAAAPSPTTLPTTS
ncbi:preprotein translocase subunit YajC [Actinomyces radicidentis]|uniref:preprotein translocase subunit YajC n=1 Tax=Actinomyces radicidentis TaxID=111015 RepID=UPI0026E0B2CF|nr:preprotein translocase subunit YajC [Actinomyces radicidentis]